jgi:hypothetical protein
MSDVGEGTGFDKFHRWTERDFPAHFPKKTVEALMRSPGWMRYYPNKGNIGYDTIVGSILFEWSAHHESLLAALRALANPDGPADKETLEAVHALTTVLRNHMQDFDDILSYGDHTAPFPGYTTPMREKGKLLAVHGQSEATEPQDQGPAKDLDKLGR